MPEADLETALDRLYGVPPEAFVEERKRLAKELRGAGLKAEAAELSKLARPSAGAWALNQVTRTDPDAVAEWLQAAEDLRAATADPAGAGGDGIRAAMTAHREASGRLASLAVARAEEAGHPLSPMNADRVRTLLQEASADAGAATWLRGGRLEGAPRRRAATPRTPKAPAAGSAPPAPRPDPRPDPAAAARAERRAELQRRVDELTARAERRAAEHDRLEAAAEAADERVENARRDLRRAESEAAAARGAVSDAERAAAESDRELDQLRAVLRRKG